MSKIANKISALEVLLNEKEAKLQKKITATLWIYVVLVVVVAAYTLIIVPKIKALTTTDTMTEIILTQVSELLTKMRTNFAADVRNNSSAWATAIVKQSIAAIPQVEEPLLEQADHLIDYAAQHVENELIPAFTDSLRENSVELKERYAEFKDEEMMQGLALIFVETIEGEVDQYINQNMIESISDLRNQLRELKTSDQILTKKQEAQRQLIVNWVYLTKNDVKGESYFGDCLNKIKQRCTAIFSLEGINAGEFLDKEPADVEGVGETTEGL